MKFAKKSLGLCLAALMALGLAPAINLDTNAPSISVHGTPVVFADQQPIVVDGRTLVPIRGVFEMLGFEIGWVMVGNEFRVTLTRHGDNVVITTGSPTFTHNGTSRQLEVPAQIIGGRTMLPIRAVVESVAIMSAGMRPAMRLPSLSRVSLQPCRPSPAGISPMRSLPNGLEPMNISGALTILSARCCA